MSRFAQSHWAWSQLKGEEARCTGMIREIDDAHSEHFLLCRCDSCGFEVGIRRGGRELAAAPAAGYDPDERTQSQPADMPF